MDSAAADLRRLERDLHDGAQARLVAPGMNLRAVEQVIPDGADAALALVAEARETAARALTELREQEGGRLRITVTDFGLGGADPARGTGLAGIERRLASFDGIVAVSSPVGGPTMVVLEVPCASSSPKISFC